MDEFYGRFDPDDPAAAYAPYPDDPPAPAPATAPDVRFTMHPARHRERLRTWRIVSALVSAFALLFTAAVHLLIGWNVVALAGSIVLTLALIVLARAQLLMSRLNKAFDFTAYDAARGGRKK